jgi:SAM-dependent methyltransferase
MLKTAPLHAASSDPTRTIYLRIDGWLAHGTYGAMRHNAGGLVSHNGPAGRSPAAGRGSTVLSALLPHLSDLSFVCPSCRSRLEEREGKLACGGCGGAFRLVAGRPDFIGAPPPGVSAPARSKGFRQWLAGLPPHAARWVDEVDSPVTNDNGNLRRYLASFPDGSRLLDLGSGARRLQAGMVSLDIAAWPEVDVVADAHRLPFAAAGFDGIVLQSVIEHVEDPARVLAEARRVVRPGGRIYVEAPFIYPEHAEADFRRWTRKGLELEVGHDFEVLESGIVMGSASALSLAWRSFLEQKLERAHWGIRSLASWATSWVRDLDRRPERHTRLYAACFVIGQAGS